MNFDFFFESGGQPNNMYNPPIIFNAPCSASLKAAAKMGLPIELVDEFIPDSVYAELYPDLKKLSIWALESEVKAFVKDTFQKLTSDTPALQDEFRKTSGKFWDVAAILNSQGLDKYVEFGSFYISDDATLTGRRAAEAVILLYPLLPEKAVELGLPEPSRTISANAYVAMRNLIPSALLNALPAYIREVQEVANSEATRAPMEPKKSGRSVPAFLQGKNLQQMQEIIKLMGDYDLTLDDIR